MNESGQGQRLGSATATNPVLGLVHDDGSAGSGESDGRREPVGARTDHYRVSGGHVFAITLLTGFPVLGG